MHSALIDSVILIPYIFLFFFFNDTATTEIYTLSLHDALPIWVPHWTFREQEAAGDLLDARVRRDHRIEGRIDRKSTRLNSSHLVISYAVFCLKKKKALVKLSLHTTLCPIITNLCA